MAAGVVAIPSIENFLFCLGLGVACCISGYYGSTGITYIEPGGVLVCLLTVVISYLGAVALDDVAAASN